MKITLNDEIRLNLEKIRATKGVENAVLTQRDGNPIQYSGIWFSKSEIFSVSAATSAIYNCGLQLHKDQLKYILIEGNKAKILLTPLRNFGTATLNRILEAQNLSGSDDEFFIAITTKPTVNLGGIFLKTRQSLIDIKKALILSGESFKPPLRHFSSDELESLLDNLNVRDDLGKSDVLEFHSMDISSEIYDELELCLHNFGSQAIDMTRACITVDGGFTAASYSKNSDLDMDLIDAEANMTYSLFSTGDKCAWLLKKMHINSILLECNDYFQFINKTGSGIFSANITKGRQKLGLLRLMIPRYCKKITEIMEKAKQFSNGTTPLDNLKKQISELVFL